MAASCLLSTGGGGNHQHWPHVASPASRRQRCQLSTDRGINCWDTVLATQRNAWNGNPADAKALVGPLHTDVTLPPGVFQSRRIVWFCYCLTPMYSQILMISTSSRVHVPVFTASSINNLPNAIAYLSNGVFSWWKSLSFGTVAHFIVTW